ncbi:U32 family peptidase, partial [Okeania sp. SIO2G5]|uniref:U32 family peptidase n=1 Tax=Okeania sp. SIO2G5 TaxID=2607796 RepID=UPI0013C23C56
DASARHSTEHQLWVAPPRITKASENYLLDQVLRCEADGYLVRNYDHLAYFADQRCIGDFPLNVANPITASYFLEEFHLERLTASYDLNIQQLDDLLTACPQGWFEVTLHQHMPMFHMEHCVFCTFLSEGTDASNCGRPCDRYEVELRDRTGAKHVLHADAGCRNTVYNSRAQTGAEFTHHLIETGLRYVRIEFLKESGEAVKETLEMYQDVIDGSLSGAEVWKRLKLRNQLGVTRGQL